MKVVVIGGASRFANVLLPRLCASDAVSDVIAIDSKPARFSHAKLSRRLLEARASGRSDALAGADALIHLRSSAGGDVYEAALLEMNVREAHKLFQAARALGVRRLVHVSTAAVYGAAIHATEDAPLRPLPGFTYAEYHAQLEQLLAIDFPDCVRLRPHVIVGAHAHPLVKLLLKQPFDARFADEAPLFQCVHEEDVADAVVSCLTTDARGAFNLAIDQSFTLRGALKLRRGFAIPLPLSAARRGIELAALITRSEAPASWIAALSRTLIVNCRRAIIDLRWKPRYAAREALRSI